MSQTLLHSLLALTFSLSVSARDWLDIPAKSGTACGKKVVIVTGDEEYRSEESGPMLAKILS